MTTEILSPPLLVPANSSRFFSTRDEALKQPTGIVQLAWRAEEPYLFNAAFDESLILHDEAYCTSVVDIDTVTQIPTLTYFRERIFPHLPSNPHVVDIGCGQGEFVDALRMWGIDATGFDPVLRRPAPHLHPRYWVPDDEQADLYVLRCVLPHIAEPWSFLEAVAGSGPGSLVLIEFQRLEWIFEAAIWYQLSHDHVNLFSLADFEKRYEVVEQGTFSAGEWGWILIDPGTAPTVKRQSVSWNAQVDDLLGSRDTMLGAVDPDRSIAIWGAAGKGIVLAHALASYGVRKISIIDADPHRWNLYIEPTGIQVLSPQKAVELLGSQTLVLVCNPNHLKTIHDRVDGRWQLALPRELS